MRGLLLGAAQLISHDLQQVRSGLEGSKPRLDCELPEGRAVSILDGRGTREHPHSRSGHAQRIHSELLTEC